MAKRNNPGFAHRHSTPRTAAVAPEVRESVPRGVRWGSVVAAWAQTASLALLFVWVGVTVDELIAGASMTAPHIAVGTALVCLAAIMSGVESWVGNWASALSEQRLRGALITRVLTGSGLLAPVRAGELLSTVTNSAGKAAQYRAAFIGPMIGALTGPLIVLLVMAIWVDRAAAGWLALMLIIVPIIVGVFQRFVAVSGTAYRDAQSRLTADFLAAVQAIGTLVYARAAERTARQLAQRGEEYRSGLLRMLAVNQLLVLVIDAAFALGIIVTATFLALANLNAGTLTAGSACALLLLAVLMIRPISVVGQFFYIGIGGRAAQRQLSDCFARFAEQKQQGSPAPSAAADIGSRALAAITLRGVTASWPGGPDVLRDFDLTVARGERVALVGPSGAGKTTVSALIQAHLLPAAGEVRVGGLDTRDVSPDSVRRQLAVVEQRPFLFLDSIAENLRLAKPGASESELWEALDAAGLRGEVEAMPDRLETHIGEHGVLLSGGQAQRLAIARAVLRDALILILDEPTSQVDLAAEASILRALDRLAVGRSVLMIAHRPSAMLAADRVVRLQGAFEGVTK